MEDFLYHLIKNKVNSILWLGSYAVYFRCNRKTITID